MVAITQGYFKDAGINLNYQPLLGTAALQVNAVISGQSDIAATGSTGLLGAVQKGQGVVGIGYVTATPGQFLVLTKKTVEKLAASGVTPTSPLADRIKALKGLTISGLGAGSSSQELLTALLKTGGLSLSNVTMDSVENLPGIYDAAKNGQVDGFFDSDPYVSQSVSDGWGVVWVSYPADEVPAATGIPWTEYVASKTFLQKDPEGAKRFMAAIWRADQTLQTNGEDPAIRNAVKAKYFSEISQSTFDQAWTNSLQLYKSVPVPSQAVFTKELALYNSVATPPYTITFNQAYDLGPVNAAKP
jgi:NitT/TauT family transport system substrate-binding protein